MTIQSSETDFEQHFAKDKGYVMGACNQDGYMPPQNYDVMCAVQP